MAAVSFEWEDLAEEVELMKGAPVKEKWVDRLDILVGQTLYCNVIETVTENLFVVSIIDANVITLAASSDQQNISIISPQTKLIIEVEELKGDRLKVSFFNLSGNLLSPRRGATPRRVEPICPFAVVRRLDTVRVTHSEGNDVYLQSVTDFHSLGTLLDEMYYAYKGSDPDLSIQWKVGDTCAAKWFDFYENWYRATIVSISTTGIEVNFIDFGNTDVVPHDFLRQLDTKYLYSSIKCLKVSLQVKWQNQSKPFHELEVIEDIDLQAKLLRDFEGNWVATLAFLDGANVIERLKLECEEGESPFDERNMIVGSELRAGDSVEIIISSYESVDSFWVVMSDHMPTVKYFNRCIRSLPYEQCSADEKVFGALFCDRWSRATSAGEGKMRLIDYGSTFPIPKEPLKKLSKELLRPISGYAVHLRLCAKPVSPGGWTDDAAELFAYFLKKYENITAVVVNVDYEIVVDLRAGGLSLSDKLIANGHAKYNDYKPLPVKRHLTAPFEEEHDPEEAPEESSCSIQ